MTYVHRILLGLTAIGGVLTVSPVSADDLFPDKNLEAVVRQYVFEKRNNDMPLVEDDVKNISTIVGKKKGIQNLQGLEKCRSLALLDLEGNEITDVSAVKELTNLQSLDLSKNKIQDIAPLSELVGLQYLHLADNQITSIAPLEKLTNLRTLYLSNNKLQGAETLAKLTKVWSLYLDGTQVTDLKPVAGLKDL